MSNVDDLNTDRSALLTDVALADLQLQHQPFATDPIDGETFMDDIAEAQLDDIKQALISGDDLLLILGPEGSGKSTLLNQLGTNSGQRIQCFSVRGSERFSTSNLFTGMLEAFKKEPPTDLKLMLDELIPCLQGMADHNTLGAIVLDDADAVPESELTKLLSSMLYLNSSDETLLRVTLAAATEFEERIPELLPEGADLPYSSLAIEAFDKGRSAAYLDFRLQKAGLEGDFPFDDNEIAAINEDAFGRPGELHSAAAQHLNLRDENYVPDLPPELGDGKRARAGGGLLARFGGLKLLVGAAALAMIFAGLFWLKPGGDTIPDDRYKVVETKKIDTTDTQQQAAGAQATTATVDSGNTQQASNTNTSESGQAGATAAEQAKLTEQQATDAAEKAKAEAQLQAKLDAEAAEKLEQEKLEKERLAKEQAANEQAAKEKAEQEKLAAEAAAKEKAAKEEAEALAKAEQEKAQQAEAAAQANLNNLESPNWILVQNANLFTVQMSASTDRQSVESFLARNQLEAPNSIFSFERNGATWYALVHGLYDSIEQARQDIEKMPASARTNQPWIRAVGRIQNALKAP